MNEVRNRDSAGDFQGAPPLALAIERIEGLLCPDGMRKGRDVWEAMIDSGFVLLGARL